MCFPIQLFDLECFERDTTTVNLVRVVTFIVASEPTFEVTLNFCTLVSFLNIFCKEFQK